MLVGVRAKSLLPSAEVLAGLAADGEQPGLEQVCGLFAPWVKAMSSKIVSTLPALDADEVGHLLWMAVLDEARWFDPADPGRICGRLVARLKTIRAEAVRAEIGRTGKLRAMTVPLEWLLELPASSLIDRSEPFLDSDAQERVDAMLDRLPADLAGRCREAMASERQMTRSDAARAASLLGFASSSDLAARLGMSAG